MEKEAEEEEQQQPAVVKEEEDTREQQQVPAAVKEQQQDDDDDEEEQYDMVSKIKLVHEGKRVKEFRVTGNLNNSNTRMIMANIIPHIEMRLKVIYSFKLVIY